MIVPENYCFQVEGFKKALSRGGGASRFLRFLSRKKDDGGTASAENISLDDMLTFSPVRQPVIIEHSGLCSDGCQARRT